MIVFFNISGGVMIIISAFLSASFLCQKEHNTIKILKNIANAYSEISSDIRTGYTNLPDAFLNVYEKSHDGLMADYFKALYREISADEPKTLDLMIDSCVDIFFKTCLTSDDRAMIKEFGHLPVHLDVNMQIKYIDELVLQIREKINSYSDVLSVKCRMYKAVCLCAGMTLVIILL